MPPDSIGEHFSVVFKTLTETNFNINQFMNWLRKCLHFMDCKLLKEMISAFTTTDLLDGIKKYEEDVHSFCEATSISSFMKSGCCIHENEDDMPNHFTQMKVRYELDMEKCTLKDVEEMRESLGRQLGLGFTPAYIGSALSLFKIESSRNLLCITWLIPSEEVPNFMQAIVEPENLKIFPDKKISGISVGEFNPGLGSDTTSEELPGSSSASVDRASMETPLSQRRLSESESP